MSENYFKWDPTKYSVNINMIDDEHQKLINYMNVLFAKCEEKASKDLIRKAMADLESYTIKHFNDEEEFFMKIADYPLKDAHKKIHKDLIEKLKGHVANFEKTGAVSSDFFTFLKVWLTAHIAGIDMKYANAYNKKSA